jgi:hypothetical protein
MLLLGAALTACGGSSGTSGGFGLVEFLESGQNNIPRNRQVRFRFSEPVAEGQDLFTRLKIQNVEQLAGQANFARAQGAYLISAEEVIFTPRLPNKPDRSDAGFRADGNYHVFISGGPDGLASASGSTIATQQEFIFETNTFFEDVIPAEPPRAIQLVAIDPTNGDTFDVSRSDPRPSAEALLDNATLVANAKVLEPGAGGAPEYATPWQFELRIGEAIDPSTVNDSTVQLHEVFDDAFTQAPDFAPADHLGNPVNFRVSATVETVQSVDELGNLDIRIRVTPLQTLVDNTRYRISFSGQVLGIDFRRTFSGDNGLTGDGASIVNGSVWPEDGGRGYVSEFLVFDRDGIDSSRTLQYDPFIDGIEPENGQTANSEDDLNSAIYNPAAAPGTAIGFLSAFGNGSDGSFAAAGGGVTELNTGDTLNEPLGNPFTVTDLNPDDDYLNNTLPGGPLTYEPVEPFEMQLEALTVSSSATLRVIGVNPVLFRVTGVVQITGTLDIAGENGGNGGGTFAEGGVSGAGGFDGADAGGGWSMRVFHSGGSGTCVDFSNYLNANAGAKAAFPGGVNGEGPGRGLAGGDGWVYYASNQINNFCTSAGGGGSHATSGTAGEDRLNASQADGSKGLCGPRSWPTRLAGVVGVRGEPGPTYGDREVEFNNMGGSGGGSAGASFNYQPGTNFAGGAGGGGGGSLTIVAAGAILVQGGSIDASGGNGGQGAIRNSIASSSTNWDKITGSGGGGAGGTISLISGDNIELTGATLNAAGGLGGPRATVGSTKTSSKDNKGGDGGKGFIFLMDADGEITGFIPGAPGNYDGDARGVLTISEFNADRFSSITAITELFPMTTAKPQYVQYDPVDDILGNVSNNGQRIRISVSSALSDPEAPTVADPSSEADPIEVALLHFDGGATKVQVTGNMNELNENADEADRRAFVRVRAEFEYDNGVEAALGPFASMDEVRISYSFNG